MYNIITVFPENSKLNIINYTSIFYVTTEMDKYYSVEHFIYNLTDDYIKSIIDYLNSCFKDFDKSPKNKKKYSINEIKDKIIEYIRSENLKLSINFNTYVNINIKKKLMTSYYDLIKNDLKEIYSKLFKDITYIYYYIICLSTKILVDTAPYSKIEMKLYRLSDKKYLKIVRILTDALDINFVDFEIYEINYIIKKFLGMNNETYEIRDKVKSIDLEKLPKDIYYDINEKIINIINK